MSEQSTDPIDTLERGHSQKSVNTLAKHFKDHDFPEYASAGDIRSTANGRFMFNGTNWVHESHWKDTVGVYGLSVYGLSLYQEMAKAAGIEAEQPSLTLDLDPDVLAQHHAGTPHHYKQGQHDLYALFIQHYGLDAWQQHVEMEVIQYLWRCRSKGTYVQDITKAKVILERILYELQQQQQSQSLHRSSNHDCNPHP